MCPCTSDDLAFTKMTRDAGHTRRRDMSGWMRAPCDCLARERAEMSSISSTSQCERIIEMLGWQIGNQEGGARDNHEISATAGCC